MTKPTQKDILKMLARRHHDPKGCKAVRDFEKTLYELIMWSAHDASPDKGPGEATVNLKITFAHKNGASSDGDGGPGIDIIEPQNIEIIPETTEDTKAKRKDLDQLKLPCD